jgi:hypothetical protein
VRVWWDRIKRYWRGCIHKGICKLGSLKRMGVLEESGLINCHMRIKRCWHRQKGSSNSK